MDLEVFFKEEINEIHTLTLKVHLSNNVKEMQYKILNNYLPTNSWLKKMKVVESDPFTFCDSEVEDL